MDVDAVKQEYGEKLPTYRSLEQEAIFILNAEVEHQKIKVHSVTSRVKSLESLLEKIQRKQCQKPFEEVRDIVGLRVICLFLSDVARLGDLIRHCFSVIAEDNKVEDFNASSFGYLSVHFVAAMKNEYRGPRYDQLRGMVFEIQVATLAMHAWATISHYLDYKTDVDVPQELRRDFYALSGLFYVADTHFEMFFKARQAARQEITRLVEDRGVNSDQEINLDTLTAYLTLKFPDRKHSDSKGVSELVSELSELDYRKIGKLEELANVAWDALVLYEEESPPTEVGGDEKTRYTDVGAVRTMLKLMSDRYCKLLMVDPPAQKYRDLLKR